MVDRPDTPSSPFADDAGEPDDPAAGTPLETPSGPFPPPPMPEVLRQAGPDEPRRPTGPIPRVSAVQSGKVFAIGMDFVYSVGGCALVGWAIDWWQKTGPTWLLVGAGLGIVVAMYRFIREGLKLSRSPGRSDPSKSK